MSRLRKTIARRMVESLQVSAQLTTVVEVDVTRISRLRDRAKGDFAQREGTKLSFLPFFALAAVEALKAHPTVNASIEDDEVTYYGAEHLGIAVDTEKGLLVPVLKNAGDLNIAGLARGIADVAERTRSNKIMPDDLAGGTFTITNTGSRGALFDTPIINQPQVAILGTGVGREAADRRQQRGGRDDRHPLDGLPRAVLRPPHRRRCGCRPLPHHDEAATRGRRLRGRPRSLTGRPRGHRMSRIVVTGSSGLIGTPLVAALRERGDEVVRLVRRPPRAADEVQWDPTTRTLDPRTLDGVDGVVHLAGAGVGDKRWTPAYKHEILASRVDGTHAVAEAVAAADHPVRFVSGSAVGYYGDRGDEELTEASTPGNDFLSDVVIAWEGATQPAVDAGASVVLLRTGIVMAPEGGAMKPMLRLARFGAGGALGSGRQFMPWITLPDEVGAILHLLDHPEITGPVNLTAAQPARQKEIAKALGASAAPPRRAAGAVVRPARRARRVRHGGAGRPAHRRVTRCATAGTS